MVSHRKLLLKKMINVNIRIASQQRAGKKIPPPKKKKKTQKQIIKKTKPLIAYIKRGELEWRKTATCTLKQSV